MFSSGAVIDDEKLSNIEEHADERFNDVVRYEKVLGTYSIVCDYRVIGFLESQVVIVFSAFSIESGYEESAA